MSSKTEITLHASAAETATGNSQDFGELQLAGPGVVYIDVTASGGTTPTLDFTLQERDPVSGKYFDSGVTFTQITTTGTQRQSISELPALVYRLLWTIGGTTPTFTFSASLIIKGS